MSHVKIVIITASVENVTVSGEVKAVEVTGLPSVASVVATTTHADTFVANAGRHSFQFRVAPPCEVTLSTVIDGTPVGPPRPIDARQVNAGRRYNFEVPS